MFTGVSIKPSSSFKYKFIKKIDKNTKYDVYHCSHFATAFRGDQWLDTLNWSIQYV